MFPSTIGFGGKTYEKKISEIPLPSNIRKVKTVGYDQIMLKYGFDYNLIGSNFQAIGLYNKDTNTMGGVSNFIKISHSDIVHLYNLQVNDSVATDLKMNWLVYDGEGTRIYWGGKWASAIEITWGTIALGGNYVQVDGYENITLKMPNGKVENQRMARLVGFKKSDYDRPLFPLIISGEVIDIGLLASGLAHRAYCVGKNNTVVDSPKGICYTYFYDPRDWSSGQVRDSQLYIPEIWLI